MNMNIDPIVTAAVQQARDANSLLWADELADRIADSTPLPLEASEIAEQITREAIREGAAVLMPAKR